MEPKQVSVESDTMKFNNRTMFMSLLYVCLVSFLTSCIPPFARAPHPAPPKAKVKHPPGQIKNEPPPWAPAHGRREKERHHYYYYPSSEVYFDGVRSMYFYMEAGTWLMAPRLPARIHININDHVTVELDGDKPYVYHAETVRKYPHGQMKEKHKNKQEKKEKKGKGKWK